MLDEQPIVLIVDDNSQNIQVLGTVLMQAGYQIHVAQNGTQALKAAQEIVPDLILLDILMPDMDGFEVCSRLQNMGHLADIPIIFLTAKGSSEDIIKGFELGAVDYICKPFNSHELLMRVRTHIELRQTLVENKELLHLLCHDLANPLNAVMYVLRDITSEMLPEKQYDLLHLAANHGLDVIKLVRQMRALEDGKLDLSEVNIAAAVNESHQILAERLAQKNIVLQIDIPKELYIWAEMTSFVNSVLNNLLSNAIKFSYPSSTITITARALSNNVALTIQDQGIGIPPLILKNLFNISRSKNRRGTSGEMGTGFGMPLVKKFITVYGGKLEIETREKKDFPDNHGTTMTLLLKIKPPITPV